MTISQSPEEIQAAILLQSKCELIRVALRECHASAEGTEDTMKAPFGLHISHNSTAHPIVDAILRIGVRFQIQGLDSSEPPSQLFGIECVFDLDYQIQDRSFQPSEASLVAFKDGNAVFNCWPYTRELVQSMALRMSINPPVLPFLRIFPKRIQPDEAATPKPVEPK
jgi:hypothetical protein